jgi:hypothetical protein
MRATSTRRVAGVRMAARREACGRGWQTDTDAGTLEERVGAAIVAAARAFAEPRWRQWAARWLDGADRGEAAAHSAFDIADAEVETRGAGPAPPAFAIPAVAARTAAQLAIGLARIEGLRRIGEAGLARSLEHITAAMAEQAGSSPTMGSVRASD